MNEPATVRAHLPARFGALGLAVAALGLAVAALGAGCTTEDGGSPSGPAPEPAESTEPVESGNAAGPVEAPPAEDGEEPMTLDPANPLPGEPFSASFDPSNSRGGFFFLYHWNGESWGDPRYLLESSASRPAPRVEPLGQGREEINMEDYGIEGPGPDHLLAPDDLTDGHWRVCTANARDHACAQFQVGQPAS